MRRATQTQINTNRSKEQKGNAMINMIVSTQSLGAGYSVICRARLSKTGRGPVAKRIQGTQYSYCAREAAKYFAAVPSAVSTDYLVGSETVHIHRIIK